VPFPIALYKTTQDPRQRINFTLEWHPLNPRTPCFQLDTGHTIQRLDGQLIYHVKTEVPSVGLQPQAQGPHRERLMDAKSMK
jgi:hypothetical protein